MATLQKGEFFQEYSVQFYMETNDEAEIYRVKDKEGETRRLKLYPFQKVSQLRFSDKGPLREVEILKEIEHHSVIRLRDQGEAIHKGAKFIYLITDFVSGESLFDKLKREGIFNPYNAISIAICVLETLEYLHNMEDPVIHNDLFMDNILLSYTEAEKPIVTNFSSAVHFSKSGRTFNPSLLNPYFMAPEQFNGITMPQSDLFAVGALIYNLCFGIPPWFVESSDREDLVSKLQDERKLPLSFHTNTPEVYDDYFLDVLRKGLSTDMNLRFLSAGDFIKALKRDAEVLLSGEQEKKKQKGEAASIKKSGSGFKDIAGMAELKEMLTNDVVRAINEKELYESYGIHIPNGMLLYGPPGCGKSFISRKFAEEIGANYVQYNPSDVKSKYVNATEGIIKEIFSDAVKRAPSVLFFDEFDALVPSRDSDLHHMNASTVNEFLAQMDNSGERGVFVIGATNRPDKIDPAILRAGRIDKKIYLAPPDKAARDEMFRLYLKNRPVDFSVDYETLAEKTEFFVSGDIKFIIDEASRAALKVKARITQEILLKVISDFIPSISQQGLQYYEELKNRMEDKRPQDQPRRPIGFK